MKKALRIPWAPLVLLALWFALVETGFVRHRAVAGPLETWRALNDGLSNGLLDDLAATMSRVVIGVGLGLLVGFALALLVSSSRRRATEPLLDFLRAIPPLLLFPLFLLGLGYGDASRHAVIAWAAALVVSLHVAAAARRFRPERLRVLRAMGATRWQIFRALRFYELLPAGLTAVRHAVATGIVVAVVTEMVVGAPHGLGSRAVAAQIAYDAPQSYAVILLTGAVGYVLSRLLLDLEERWIFWESPRQSSRG